VKPYLELAPLHGITNRYFRAAFCTYFKGFEGIMAPFILGVPGTGQKPSHFKDLIPPERGVASIPRVIPQVLGNDPQSFYQSSAILLEAGYEEVNWNLGCPYGMVAKKFRGSGLLPFPDRIDSFLHSLFDNLSGLTKSPAISVKLRLGRFDPKEILALMPILNSYPLSRIVIHPRGGIQMYKGKVDLTGFETAAAHSRHPVHYNGDIETVEDWRRISGRFPSVSGWMIGRGALRNPFLAQEILNKAEGKNETENGDRRSTIRAFHDDLYQRYRKVLSGPGHTLDKMKEVWTYLGASFPDRHRELAALPRTKSFQEYEGAVSRIFD
jgi:tRNA-dihydrouridine synthase